ncbi:hypothetical protein RND81_03G150300 [Saponaria officinalis]|uniref:Uncharacterized protein n=1 Tax=Saponaria officinalis TaxID=3572 RepID=A0AAW1HR59_SAPOF
MKGVRKRIGNGLDTRVWVDPWIPGTQTRMVLSSRTEETNDMRVAELLNNEGNGWDLQKLQRYFLPVEQERILAIRISSLKPEDSWCWELEKDGVYSVRSAYKKLLAKGEEEAEQSDYATEKKLWNMIWKAAVLPRVKIFF